MTDWQRVIDADFAVPADASLSDLVAELVADLRSADPRLRDRQALPVLGTWIEDGTLGTEAVLAVGDAMAERFDDPEIQARTFAPLVLDVIVTGGQYRPQWLDAFAAWFPAETDLRGHDSERGWLHAVAHGADLLGSFGRYTDADPARLLELATARLLAPTEYVWRDQEDDRLAFAIAHILTRSDLTEAQSTDWLGTIETDFTTAEPGPPPPYASNTMRTLRLLYILADRGVRPSWRGGEPIPPRHREAVRARLAEVLAAVAPFTG